MGYPMWLLMLWLLILLNRFKAFIINMIRKVHFLFCSTAFGLHNLVHNDFNAGSLYHVWVSRCQDVEMAEFTIRMTVKTIHQRTVLINLQQEKNPFSGGDEQSSWPGFIDSSLLILWGTKNNTKINEDTAKKRYIVLVLEVFLGCFEDNLWQHIFYNIVMGFCVTIANILTRLLALRVHKTQRYVLLHKWWQVNVVTKHLFPLLCVKLNVLWIDQYELHSRAYVEQLIYRNSTCYGSQLWVWWVDKWHHHAVTWTWPHCWT